MQYALILAENILLDAQQGNYQATISKTALCPHCKSPVYWRSSGKYFNQQLQKEIKFSAAWIHYRDCDHTCPFYVNHGSSNQDRKPDQPKSKSREQRQSLLLEHFYRVLELALGASQLETKAKAIEQKLLLNCQVAAAGRFSPNLDLDLRQQAYLTNFLGILREKIYQERLQIYLQLEENSLAIEVLEFLLINKNQAELSKLLLFALDDYQGNLAKITAIEIKKIIRKVKQFLIKSLVQANFQQAYLLCRTDYEIWK